MITLSKSPMICCHDSGLSGAADGMSGLRYPGSTVGNTGLKLNIHKCIKKKKQAEEF